MAATQDSTPGRIGDAARRIAERDTRSAKIDLKAPAGSKNSLGEESVRDGRPATDNRVVEAIDEETPVTPAPPSR
jgi:hypothetical protein